MRARLRPSLPVLAALVAVALSPRGAAAVCNAIPRATAELRGAVGTTNRPFASPGDFVTLRVRPQLCDKTSTGFVDLDTPGGSARTDDYAVTVLFTPPVGARNAVILAEDCAALAPELASCDAALSGGVSCVDVDAGAGESGLVAPDDGTLSFRFPDTDGELQPADDDLVFAGPTRIAVTPVTAALPCAALAATRCADAGAGLVACIDELYEVDGTCRKDAKRIDRVFPSFTALPPANSYQAMCDTPGSPCLDSGTPVRVTADAAGNVLIPFDWSGVRVFLDGVPVPRLVRGTTAIEAFLGGAIPVKVPGQSFVASFSPEGVRVPPIFTPLPEPAQGGAADLALFGTVDAARGVSRVARRSASFRACSGGTTPGLPCHEDEDCAGGGSCEAATCQAGPKAGQNCKKDADCPSSECGASLFEFRDRFHAGVGPIVIGSSDYVAEAKTLVPLDGLLETPDVFAFAVNEGLEDEDLNLDTDQFDLVMTLGDRAEGLGEPLSAVVRVRRPPFSFAASVAEGEVLAYLEPEPHEGDCSVPAGCDHSGDGDVADTLLRVFRRDPDGPPDELSAGQILCADAAPVVAQRPLALVDGLVFFRTPEAACAERRTERVTVTEAGFEAAAGGAAPNVSSMSQCVSADGELALVESASIDMAAGKAAASNDVFLRDRELGTTQWLSFDSGGDQANASVDRAHLSADGGVVVFDSTATDLVPGTPDARRRIYVRDLDAGTTTYLGTPATTGCPASDASGRCNSVESLSRDGRYVVFTSRATDVVPAQGTPAGQTHVFLYDRLLDLPEMIDLTSAAVPASASSSGGAISADGSRVAFASNATNLDPPDGNPFSDIYLRDRNAGTTVRVSVASDGSYGVGFNLSPAISGNGSVVTFLSDDAALVPADTNGAAGTFDAFAHDLETGLTERVNLSSEGLQGLGGGANATALSESGRFAAFSANNTNLVADDTNAVRDVFVHDRLTGLTQRVNLSDADAQSSLEGRGPVSLSADGQIVSFASADAGLVPGDGNAAQDTFVRAPEPVDPEDLNGDGDVRDTHLRVIDTAGTPTPVLLGPAEDVAVHQGSVAFLRPEAADGSLLNGDADAADTVVHFWANRQVGAPANLQRAATAVALSADWIAALVPETGEGVGDRNGDTDSADRVVEIAPAVAGPPSWVPVSPARAADAVDVVGHNVAFLVPEAAQGGSILNGDGDAADRVLHLQRWDGNAWAATNVGQAAEEFVLGDRIVAFRTREASQGAGPLNGDGDDDDDVLQVFDLETGQLVNSGMAVVPCRLEACDPRLPYRVSGDSVTFLTRESDQGVSLNADSDTDDIVVQTFNVRKALAIAAAEAAETLAAIGAGVCTDDGAACASDLDCTGGGRCIVPPGGCLDDLGGFCGFDGFGVTQCPAGQLCVLAPGMATGTCHALLSGSCQSDADCGALAPGAFCADVDQDLQKIVGPLTDSQGSGQVFMGAGLCVEDEAPPVACSDDEDCAAGRRCGEAGACQIVHGTCDAQADCTVGVCSAELAVVSAADFDGDGVIDPADNCPALANTDQADLDEDGIGDACDRATCGDGVQTYEEGCDDGNRVGGDACDAVCQPEGIACADGVDSDGDGLVDFPADTGCTDAADTSERGAGVCDNGVDDDEDGAVDDPQDVGCRNPSSTFESPRCQNGLDDDNDGKIDFDGGAAANGGTALAAADPQCTVPYRAKETPGCGIGFELVFVFAALAPAMRRRSSRGREREGDRDGSDRERMR